MYPSSPSKRVEREGDATDEQESPKQARSSSPGAAEAASIPPMDTCGGQPQEQHAIVAIGEHIDEVVGHPPAPSMMDRLQHQEVFLHNHTSQQHQPAVFAPAAAAHNLANTNASNMDHLLQIAPSSQMLRLLAAQQQQNSYTGQFQPIAGQYMADARTGGHDFSFLWGNQQQHIASMVGQQHGLQLRMGQALDSLAQQQDARLPISGPTSQLSASASESSSQQHGNNNTLTPREVDTLLSPDLLPFLDSLNAQHAAQQQLQQQQILNRMPGNNFNMGQMPPLHMPPVNMGMVPQLTQPVMLSTDGQSSSPYLASLLTGTDSLTSDTAAAATSRASAVPSSVRAATSSSNADQSISFVPDTLQSSSESSSDDLPGYLALGLDEDHNFLTPFQCYTRSEFVEVFQARQQDVETRSTSKSVSLGQIGIRCRFCRHLEAGTRVSRSSAFPSSIRQLYQSYTMMIRDHFGKCQDIPPDKRERYNELKQQSTQGVSDSRQYWVHAAMKLGMSHSEEGGIHITRESRLAALQLPPYGLDPDRDELPSSGAHAALTITNDQTNMSPFLRSLLLQVQVVYLLPSERVGRRQTLAIGLTGLGCRHCCQANRLGQSRVFPLKRKALQSKLKDLYTHFQRCTLCPADVKDTLKCLYEEKGEGLHFRDVDDSAALDLLWRSLGRQGDINV